MKKRIIWRIGKLSDQQADQIRLILGVAKAGDQLVTRIEDIVVQESRSCLDIAVVNHIWDEWKLSEAFDYDATEGSLPTHAVARVLTINRCTDPCANYSVAARALRSKNTLNPPCSNL